MGAVSWACGLFGLVILFTLIDGSSAILALGWDGPLPTWLVSLYVSWGLTTLFAFIAWAFCCVMYYTRDCSNTTPRTRLVARLLLFAGVSVFIAAIIAWAVTGWATGWALLMKSDEITLIPSSPVLGLVPEQAAKIKSYFLFFLVAPALIVAVLSALVPAGCGFLLIISLVYYLGLLIYEGVQQLDRAYENWTYSKNTDPAEIVAMLPPQSGLSTAKEGRVSFFKTMLSNIAAQTLAHQKLDVSGLLNDIADVVSDIEQVAS